MPSPRSTSARALGARALATTPAVLSDDPAHAIADLKRIAAVLLKDGKALGGDPRTMGATWLRQYLDADPVLRDRVLEQLLAAYVRVLVDRVITSGAIA